MGQGRSEGLAGLGVPDPSRAVLAGRGDASPVRTVGCPHDPVAMPERRAERAASRQVPLLRRKSGEAGVGAGGQEDAAVGPERNATDRRAGLQWRQRGPAGRNVPDPRRPVGGGRREKSAIGAECQAEYLLIVFQGRHGDPSRGDVPDPWRDRRSRPMPGGRRRG